MDNKPSHRTLSLCSKWCGDSQVRVKVRKIGHSDKIAVDLTVLSPEVTYAPTAVPTDAQLKRIACNAVSKEGVASFDHCLLKDVTVERKTTRLDGSMSVTTVREMSLAFHGVNS